MTSEISFRRAVDADMREVFAIFRRSLFDYMFRRGMATAEEAANPPIESAWARQADWIQHLSATAEENWVAVDDAGVTVGWAMSIARGDHLELTHFFVLPGIQGKGIGRGLIARAFPDGRFAHKTIMALQDERATSVYLRSGVGFVTTSIDMLMDPGGGVPDAAGDLEFRQMQTDPVTIAAVGDVEFEVLGFRRDADIAFLIAQRPGWLALRDGRVVGYVFGIQPNPPGVTDFPPSCGPMAALDPEDVAALIDQMIRTAPADSNLCVTVPLSNRRAVAHLLALGARVDPFFINVLASNERMRMDRYVHTLPSFII